MYGSIASLHPQVPQTTSTELLRNHPIAGEYIFDEALVSRAVSLRSNFIMLDTLVRHQRHSSNPHQVSSKKPKIAVVMVQRAQAISLGNLPVRENAKEPKGRDVHDVHRHTRRHSPFLHHMSDQSPEKIATRLSPFSSSRSAICADHWVMYLVQGSGGGGGYRIPFMMQPP